MNIYKLVERESLDTSLSNNGGDYTNVVHYLVDNNQVVGIHHTTSWDGGCCTICGRYSHNGEICCQFVSFNQWDYQKATELGHLIESNIEVGEVEVVKMAYGWDFTNTDTYKVVYKVVEVKDMTFYMA